MSSAVAGYKQTLGADAPPACYDDIDHADCLFIAGSQHGLGASDPVPPHRGRARRANPALKIIVVDPRRTDTAEIADLHLPIQPGTDVALFNGMLHLHAVGRLDRRATTSPRTPAASTRCKATVRDCTPRLRRRRSAASAKDDLLHGRALVRDVGARRCRLYCQGLNQSSQRHREERGADQPAPGDRPDRQARRRARSRSPASPTRWAGAKSAAWPTCCSAHRDLGEPGASRRGRARCGASPSVPATAGQDRGRDVRGRGRRRDQGAVDRLHQSRAVDARPGDRARARSSAPSSSCVQEAFATTATCAYADLLLPATTWGEKEGTVTNSERRISRVRAGGRRARARRAHDWAIAVDFARRLERGCGRAAPTLFPYATPEAVWNEHRESTRGRDLDITGLSYAMLEAAARSNGRCPKARRSGTRAPLRRRRVPDRRRPRPLRRHAPTSRWPSRATRAIRSRSTPGACATSGTA